MHSQKIRRSTGRLLVSLGGTACVFHTSQDAAPDLYGPDAICLDGTKFEISAPGQTPALNCGLYEVGAQGRSAEQEPCASADGRETLDAMTQDRVREILKARLGMREVEAQRLCGVRRLSVPAGQSCLRGDRKGWCYVVAAGMTSAGPCARALVVQRDTPRASSRLHMVCEQW